MARKHFLPFWKLYFHFLSCALWCTDVLNVADYFLFIFGAALWLFPWVGHEHCHLGSGKLWYPHETLSRSCLLAYPRGGGVQRRIRLTRAPLSPETIHGANHCWEETLWSRAFYKLCRKLPSGVTALELPVFLQTTAMKSLVHLDRLGKNHSALG